ncbi:MAG: DegT/DnrJ/EryC1/StrS family aminotransferase [Puniceicoccaceae bacterium]
MARSRIYLSPPCTDDHEAGAVLAAVHSGWVAPVGPELEQFEAELSAFLPGHHAVLLSSGTAAIHLALLLAGVGQGDKVIASSFSFIATANPIRYCGAEPVFVDSARETWNLDLALLKEAVESLKARGTMPKAVVATDLFGSSAGCAKLEEFCQEEGILLIEDAAEAIGARDGTGAKAGSHGFASAFSFNGNKIITTGGGGALITRSKEAAARARFLATQAREPVIHYEHRELGFNYRMSNVLAALGRIQFRKLDQFIAARASIRRFYRDALAGFPEIGWNPLPEGTAPNHWLTVMLAPSEKVRDRILQAAQADEIEARPAWKPLHLQPIYAGSEAFLNGVGEEIFQRAVCLPSGSGMRRDELERVVTAVCTGLRDER